MLGLLTELLRAERPRTKQALRALPGYAGLSESAFESQFQRDKNALRDAGVVLEVVPGAIEAYRVSPDSFAHPSAPLEDLDLALIHLAVSAWQRADADPGAIGPKIAATTDAHAPELRLALGLEGADAVASIAEAIARRRIVSFRYPSAEGDFARAVEPWRLVVRGRALYLWGRDLDRECARLFRLSRFQSEVDYLGEDGDAEQEPEGAGDPFDALLLAPRLLLRKGGAERIRAHAVTTDGPAPSGWTEARGEPGEAGEWISRILAEAEDAIVRDPVELRDALLERLRAAASWGRSDA